MELLEIAKASAAKSLGIPYLDLPASLRTVPVAKRRNCGTAVPNTVKFEVSQIYPDKTSRKTARKIWLAIFYLSYLRLFFSESLLNIIAKVQ